ncbi:hypothetical protein [Hymenobacter koreensis]|uniref:Uncharacterized protein n=1 Tax=Hymenobacter koreensis TaxID=1084523 RepID=A0ABP8IUF7_9BACT
METTKHSTESLKYRLSHPSWWVYMLTIPGVYLLYCVLYWSGVLSGR